MHVHACSEIITRALSIQKSQNTETREAAVAQDILKDLSSPNSRWRKPFAMNLLERIWRPIRNIICTKAYCEYDDIRKNLSTLRQELTSLKEITVQINGLHEQTELEHIRNQANGVLSLYTHSLENATNHSSILDPQKKSAIIAMIQDINKALKEAKVKTALPNDLSQHFDDVQNIQRALKGPVPNLAELSSQLSTLQNRCKDLPDYEESSLQQEIFYTSSLLEIKKELQATKESLYTLSFTENTASVLAKKRVEARTAIENSQDYKRLVPDKREQLTALFDAALTDALSGAYREMLNGYKQAAQKEIMRSQNILATADRIWIELSKAFQQLDAQKVDQALKNALSQDLENVATILGKELFNKANTSVDFKTKISDEIAQIKENKLSPEALALAQDNVNQTLAQLQKANQCYDDLKDRLSKIAPSQKSPFLQQTLIQLVELNREYIALLQDYQRAIDEVKPGVTATLTAIKDQVYDNSTPQTNPKDNRSYTDLTQAGQKAGWFAPMAQFLGWSSGSRDLVAMAGITENYASATINACSVFTSYALSGYCTGRMGPLGALAFGAGAVVLAYSMPTIKQVMPNPVLRHVTGPLIMAAYATYAPTLASALTARGPESSEILRNRALNHTDNALHITNELQNNTKTAVNAVHNVTHHQNQALVDLAKVDNHLNTVNQSIGTATRHLDVGIQEAVIAQGHGQLAVVKIDSGIEKYGTQEGQSELFIARDAAQNCSVEAEHSAQALDLARQDLLAAQEAERQAKTTLQNVTDEVTMAKAEAAIANETLQIAQNKEVQLEKELNAVKHNLNQMKNPVRNWGRFVHDLAIGGAAVIGGACHFIAFQDGVGAGSIIAWGTSTITGDGYTGT